MLQFLANHPPHVTHWLILTNGLFAIGLYGLLTRRNAIGVLLSVELMLNSAAVNFVLFNKFMAPGVMDGAVMMVFIVSVAAAETVVAIAIMVALFKQLKTIDMNQMNRMRD